MSRRVSGLSRSTRECSARTSLTAFTVLHRCTPFRVQLKGSLFGTLNVLRDRQPISTPYIQLLRSRVGQPLSLFTFCRLLSNRIMDSVPSFRAFIHQYRSGGVLVPYL